MDKKQFKSLIRECIEEILSDNLSQDDSKDPLYVEYLKPMRDETPFMIGGKKYEYCWAKYPDGKRDIGVYSYSDDMCYGYNAFREMYNLPESVNEKTSINEATVYHDIVFAQGDDAVEPLEIYNNKGVNAAIKYLSQWDYRTEMEHSPQSEPPWGSSDKVFKKGEYILTVNSRLGYIGLVRTQRVPKEKEKKLKPMGDERPMSDDEFLKKFPPSKDGLDEMTTTGAVQGFLGKNWVDPDPKRKKMKSIAAKSVGGSVTQ